MCTNFVSIILFLQAVADRLRQGQTGISSRQAGRGKQAGGHGQTGGSRVVGRLGEDLRWSRTRSRSRSWNQRRQEWHDPVFISVNNLLDGDVD